MDAGFVRRISICRCGYHDGLMGVLVIALFNSDDFLCGTSCYPGSVCDAINAD
jgi:hypothetical protein